MPFPTMANLIFNPQQVFTIFLLLLLLPHANSVTFNFSSFPANVQNLTFEGDAFSNGELQVTKNQRYGNLNGSVGRASYSEPVRLWDASTYKLTDFTTHFSFRIKATNKDIFGDGLSFFLAPFNSTLPPNSVGGYLGLFSKDTALNTSKNQIVAVEFDTYPNNGWDPAFDHVGINVNSIVSVANVSWSSSLSDGSEANAWITYNSTTHNLSVFLTYAKNPVFSDNSSLWYIVDLRKVLPEKIRVGFSAATGDCFELHTVLSWAFSSTLEVTEMKNNITQDMPMMQTNKNITTEDMPMTMKKNKNSSGGLVVGLVVLICVLSALLGLFCFIRRRRGRTTNTGGEDVAEDESMDDEFEKGTGPKRFTFSELSRSTNNFSEEGKLGEGGFGGVYKGLLSGSNIEVAVKRISSGSKQGKKEYVSEVRIISRLRHRNLVQLIGWCHEKGEFLLVYEYMPNGSLDAHLFSKNVLLAWTVRYKIALGLASALLYLHEEWEQCVVHRDIKSSNIMLDSQFNAKLGDFGLARLVDHELGSQTTLLAGTIGYLAPECLTTGKSSKESDVFSFGVVALEITCGRKPVDMREEEPSKVRLVEWVWDLYGKGQLLEAADKRLNMEFEEAQIECLMIVGLWCCHPDYTLRPSIRQVINVLNFEAALPSLPSKQPVPTYYAPPMDICRLSYTTSSGFPDSEKYLITQGSSSTTNSSLSISSTVALLYSPKSDV